MSLVVAVVVCLAWCTISFFVARIIKKWTPKILKVPVFLFIFALMIPLPIFDEIIGWQQFKVICEKNSEIKVATNARGREVYLMRSTSVEIPGNLIPIRLHE